MSEQAAQIQPGKAIAPRPRNDRGQGRKPGSAEIRTRRRANELAEKQETPLDIMADNMLFWAHLRESYEKEAKDLYEAAMALEVTTDEDRKTKLNLLSRAIGLREAYLLARDKSQSCAVEAAPYCHARFQAIAFKGTMDHTAREAKKGMSAKDAMDSYLSSLAEDPFPVDQEDVVVVPA